MTEQNADSLPKPPAQEWLAKQDARERNADSVLRDALTRLAKAAYDQGYHHGQEAAESRESNRALADALEAVVLPWKNLRDVPPEIDKARAALADWESSHDA